MKNTPNLIVGMATGMYSNIKSMEHFVKSIRMYNNDEVVIITENKDKEFVSFFEKYNINLHFITENIPTENVIFKRWSLAKEVIMKNYNVYDNIILSDTRDVIFQGNPFKYLSGKSLDLCLETKSIKDCPDWNGRWIKNIYGQEMFEKIKENYIICAGITAGKKDSIIQLCDLMLKEHNRLGKDFVDQAYLNVMYAKNILPEHILHHTGESFVATIGSSFGDTVLDNEGFLITKNGMRPSVVHQYDRHTDKAHIFLENIKNEQ